MVYSTGVVGNLPKDAEALSEILDDSFVLVHMTGMRQPKPVFIRSVARRICNFVYGEDTRVDSIVAATDAGREGEAISRLVYHQCGCTKPVQRLWISSMEEDAIRKGLENLSDSSRMP